MEVSAAMVKELRERTGAGMMDCKGALKESGGDIEKALEYLRIKGLAKAAKKSSRDTREGTVTSYIHPGSRIGVTDPGESTQVMEVAHQILAPTTAADYGNSWCLRHSVL